MDEPEIDHYFFQLTRTVDRTGQALIGFPAHGFAVLVVLLRRLPRGIEQLQRFCSAYLRRLQQAETLCQRLG